MNVPHRWIAALIATLLLVAVAPAVPARAVEPGTDPFQRTWSRTDAPVAGLQVDRTWVWGPGAFTAALHEPYIDSPGGTRVVQYFDKARMEITNPGGDLTSHWYVTNGLLVVEMASGQLQVGDSAFEPREPADISVAGDPDDDSAPTYATMGALRTAPPQPEGATITQHLARDGTVTDDPALARYGVTAGERVQAWGIDHRVASVFEAYVNASGPISHGGRTVSGTLFPDRFYATGLPITEAYWTTARVRGAERDVLVQCFERRCLTYTPDNPDGWQVEMGNVGRHYYEWRYGIPAPAEPLPVTEGTTHLPPTPLDDWGLANDGLAQFRMSNQTPFALTLRIDGPITTTLEIPPCPDCVVYTRANPPLACRDDTPARTLLLPPGNYRILAEYAAPHTDRPSGHWTLTPDTLLDTCWVVVER